MTGEGIGKESRIGQENRGFSSSEESKNGQVKDNMHVQRKGFPQGPEFKTSSDNKSQPDDVEEDSDEVDLSCGLGSCRTNIFGTKFANLYVFAVCFGLSHLFTSMIMQVIHVQLTSLERQFNIDNSEAGLFDSAARAGFLSTVLFAGHFAKKSNIPMVIGVSGMIQGLVLLAPPVLQFVDPYELPVLTSSKGDGNFSNSTDLGDNGQYLCYDHIGLSNSSNGISSSENKTEVNRLAYVTIFVIQAVKGITDTFHNGFLPTLYMDDNMLDKSRVSIYMGIMHVISELSAPIGKQINGVLTEVPIDLKETEMDPKDRRFVSAWWLAFLVFGVGTIVFSFPIILFPRRLISKRQRKAALAKAMVTFAGGEVQDEVMEPDKVEQLEPESNDAGDQVGQPDEHEMSEKHGRRYSVNDADGHRKRSVTSNVSRRRSSLFPAVTGPTERRVSLTGDLVFEQPVAADGDFPRALLRVFRTPVLVVLLVDVALAAIPLSGTSIFRQAYMANEYNIPMSEVALVSGITSAVGHITGTILSSLISRKVTTKLGYVTIVLIAYIMINCIIPVYFFLDCPNVPVYGDTSEMGIPLNVTSDCDCSMERQLIACGDDGRNYYSPCFAGCTDADGKLFTECKLLANTTTPGTVTPGLCDTDCHSNFIIYSILHGLHFTFDSLSLVPRRLLMLRTVDPRDRGFAVSLYMFSYIMMAIPAPNILGRFIDGTCVIWDDDYCAVYDRDSIRYLMSGVDQTVAVLDLTACIVMFCLIKGEAVKYKREMKRKGTGRSARTAAEETREGPV